MINNMNQRGFIPLEIKNLRFLPIRKRVGSLTGFTLIETLVAVLLLATAIAGPLSIASKGLNATLVAKDQFIAFYLAQDAMEFVRYARDSNTLGDKNWLTGAPTDINSVNLTPCANNPTGCYFDSLRSDITPPTTCTEIDPITNLTVCPKMKFDTSLQSYRYASGTYAPQQFRRTIKITGTSLVDDEAVVTVTVSWSDMAGVTHKAVTVRENLFNWQ